jgi:serine/threonine-protein kinase
MIGTRLAHYEITAHLGSGGMGEVYQATDTKLGRSVAIKLLPVAFASDGDRLLRFAREAVVLATLNHPNIAQIYGMEESGDTRCIVMELVEGETLQARLQRGAIELGEALAITRQIVEALEAAHEKGVVHRDLKPGNVMLTAEGRVKVLDFGLAKAYEAHAANVNLTNSPTLASMAATQVGVILGTAAYMSPEQAKGRAVDRRTDIFALGCILFEMLTGKPAFDGEDVTDILGAVLRIEPDWSGLPSNLPPGVHSLLRVCLEKNPKNRRSDATDVRLDIEQILKEPEHAPQLAPVEIPKRSLWVRTVPIAVALLLGGAIAGAVIWKFRAPAASSITRFSIVLDQGQNFTNTGRSLVAISPDGSQLVYVANQRLYHRQMSEVDARPIPGTEVSGGVLNPAFSPDGQSLVFNASSDRTLKRIAVSGGASVTLCTLTEGLFGLSWSEEGIAFGQGSRGIFKVDENGGNPVQLASVEPGEQAHGPQILPGGGSVLYTVRKDPDWDKGKIFVQSLRAGSKRQLLIDGGSDARYVSTGHIVYAYQGTLFAVPFNLAQLKVTAGPTPVVEGVRRASGGATGSAHFSFSNNGTLVYIPGPISGETIGAQRTLALLDRKGGGPERMKTPARPYAFLRVSPDRKRAAVSTDDENPNVWIIDLVAGTAPRQLTLGGKNQYPVWSHDGERVAFQSDREGDQAIFWQKADGTGVAERLTKPDQGVAHMPDSWSPDGKTLSYSAVKGAEAAVWIHSIQDKKSTVFASQASAVIARSAFSPDGQWLAYQSNETGQNQIFVQPFPATGAKYPIVRGGQPAWSLNGNEIYYNAGVGQIGVISIKIRPTFSFGEPFVFPAAGWRGTAPAREPRPWDISPDGKQLLGVIPVTEAATAGETTLQIRVVLNWFTDLKQRVREK